MATTEIVQAAEITENVALLEQQRVLNSMLARSATDPEFRALMLADARAAFAVHGLQLPEGLDVRFIENRHDVTIVLPDAIDDMLELSEEELAQMGGASWVVVAETVVKMTVFSGMVCAGAAASIGAVALTIYLASE